MKKKTYSSGLAVIVMDGNGPQYEPRLDDRTVDIRGPRPFNLWWNQWVLEDLFDDRFNREELVLFLANKFGGAHVDAAIQPRLYALTRLNSLGWGWHREGSNVVLGIPAQPEDTLMESSIPVNVRQVAYEVERTLTEQLADFLEEPAGIQ